jgi:hypothetical protein
MRADYYGFLFRGVVHEVYYFRLFGYVTSWAFAVQNVFSATAVVRIFVPGIFFVRTTRDTPLTERHKRSALI